MQKQSLIFKTGYVNFYTAILLWRSHQKYVNHFLHSLDIQPFFYALIALLTNSA